MLRFLGFAHSEPLTENFLSSEKLKQYKSRIHFLIGFFKKIKLLTGSTQRPGHFYHIILIPFVPLSCDFVGVNNKNKNNNNMDTK